METGNLTIDREKLLPFIEAEGKLLDSMLEKAKKKFGPRYNHKNRLEQMHDKFGNPRFHAERFANEFLLIVQKKSKLPASIRYIVQEICDRAVRKMVNQLEKEQKQNERVEK